MNRKPMRLTFAVLALTLISTATALAAPDVVRSGNLVLSDDGALLPPKLPKQGTAPATARLEAEIATVDGSHPPALRTIDLEVADNVQVDAAGLPVCRAAQIQATSSTVAKRACGDALLGSGSAEVEVAFPEQPPFSSTGPLLLFNAGIHGGTTKVLLHAYAGSVTKFRLLVGRKFTDRGKPKSFLTAGCPAGHWSARGEAGFEDGTKLQVLHVFPCTASRL